MNTQRLLLAIINVLGGIAVLGSYVYGIATHDDAARVLWGGVPESLRPLYQASMLAAAVGYLAFTWFVFFRVDPEAARLPGGLGYAAFNVLYLVILVPSATWMSLTFAYAAQPGAWRFALVRAVLLTVGLGAAVMVAAVAAVEPRDYPGARLLGICGAAAFAFHTLVLDAIVWPWYYRGA